jgi:hypothetical protein
LRHASRRERFGAGTFPQIVIGDAHIGGAAEIAALDARAPSGDCWRCSRLPHAASCRP